MSDAPTLTADEKFAFSSMAQHSLANPEFAASFYVDPREVFLAYNLSEEQMDNITAYFRYVGQLIEKRRGPAQSGSQPPSPEATSAPTLSGKQRLDLGAIAKKATYNAEFAASFYVDPREILLAYAWTQDDIDTFKAYFEYVSALVQKNVRSDWW